MKLTRKERGVIEEFKRRVEKQFPGEIVRLLVFGSKARGDATEQSDIDVIVIPVLMIRNFERIFVILVTTWK